MKKKAEVIESVNTALLRRVKPAAMAVGIQKVDEAEGAERWSFVDNKKAPRWLWHAIAHQTGTVLAYVFGRRQDEVFLEFTRLLAPFGITRDYPAHWGAYERHLVPEAPCPGKRTTQHIERKPLTLRTRIKRLARKTICFSQSRQMHDLVSGLFVNRYECGITVYITNNQI